MKLADLWNRIFGRGGDDGPDPGADRARDGGAHDGVPRAKPVDPMANELPDPEGAYGYGVADGRKELAPEHFRRYVEHTVEQEEIDAKLARLDAREERLDARLEEIHDHRATSTERGAAVADLRERTGETTKRLDEIGRELEATRKQRREIRKPGLLGYTAIFGVAAVVFILADLIITRAIVADALALTGRNFVGIDEAWYFASALALVAVLLKPGYDRLVEADYWEGGGRWFTVTILVASVLALATLFVLGVFRTVAFEAQTLQDLALEASGGALGEQMAELRELQRTVVTSLWGKAAFVMSGVLFAAAGAICLGISLRHYHDFRHLRWPLLRRQRTLRKEQKRLRKRRRRDGIDLTAARGDVRRADLRLSHLHSPDRIREELESVREAQRRLLEHRTIVRGERFKILYDDGYERGRHLGDPDERPRPYVAVRRSIRTAFDGADRVGSDMDPAEGTRLPDTDASS